MPWGQMTSPQFQNTFNDKQRSLMSQMFSAITSGDVSQMNKALRSISGPATEKMSTGANEYSNVLRAIASDYMNLGGVSPATRALIDAQGVSEGFSTNKAERESGARAMHGVFRQLASALPQVTTAGADTQVRMLGMQPDQSSQDYIQQYLTNQALQYMDPTSKQETQQYLARTNPMMFRAYGMMPGGPVAPTLDTVDPAALRDSLTKFSGSLDYGQLSKALTPQLGGASLPEASSGINWLQDYLKTALGGIGGTRAQQQFSQARLGTLEREAQAKPQDIGQFLTLAENLTNPVTKRASLSGLVGGRRAAAPGSEFMRRGLIRRNPYQV